MLSVRSKLTIAFSIFFAVLIAQLALVYYFSNTSASLTSQAIKAHEQSNALTRLAIEGQKLRRYEKEFFIYADNPERRAKYSGEWNDSYGKLKEGLALLNAPKSGWSESDREKAQTWSESLNAYATGFNKVDVAVNNGFITGTINANKAIKDAKNQFRVFLKGTAVEIDNKIREASEYSSHVDKNFANIQKFLMGLSVVALVIGGALLLTIPRAIAEPISALTESVIDISKGNITRPVTVRGGPEVKGLAESVERLRVALKGMMLRMNKLQQARHQGQGNSPSAKPKEVA
jgi:methyl-accepting chemotaxis protein